MYINIYTTVSIRTYRTFSLLFQLRRHKALSPLFSFEGANSAFAQRQWKPYLLLEVYASTFTGCCAASPGGVNIVPLYWQLLSLPVSITNIQQKKCCNINSLDISNWLGRSNRDNKTQTTYLLPFFVILDAITILQAYLAGVCFSVAMCVCPH